MRKAVLALALIALAPRAIGACGGDDDAEEPVEAPVETPAPDAEATTLQVTADPDGNLAYLEESLTGAAGEVTIEFDNPASIPHDVVIEDADGNDVGGTEVIVVTSSDGARAEGENVRLDVPLDHVHIFAGGDAGVDTARLGSAATEGMRQI
jgi:hypothetical protein